MLAYFSCPSCFVFLHCDETENILDSTSHGDYFIYQLFFVISLQIYSVGVSDSNFFADADFYSFADANSALFQFLLENNYKISYFFLPHILYIRVQSPSLR